MNSLRRQLARIVREHIRRTALDSVERLLRVQDREKLVPKERGPVLGTIGSADASTPVVEEPVATVVIEHGFLNYQGFPPITGAAEASLIALIAASQSAGPPIPSHQAAAALPRSASLNTYQTGAPPSSWTDLMREHVQALYGSSYTDYTTQSLGGDQTITYQNVGGSATDTTLGVWWGGTGGLMRIGKYRYQFFAIFNDRVEVYNTYEYAQAISQRAWLIANETSLSAEAIKLEEQGILAGIRPMGPATVVWTHPGSGFAGAPLSYGWRFYDNYPGGNAGECLAKVVCLSGGDPGPGIGSHTHELTISFNGTATTVAHTTTDHTMAGIVAPGCALFQLGTDGIWRRWGESGTTDAAANFPVFGFFQSDGIWRVENYIGVLGNQRQDVLVNTRTPCSGTAAGTHFKGWVQWNNGSGQFSSGPLRTSGSVTMGSEGGLVAPYGSTAGAGTTTNVNPSPTWSSSNFPTDYCGDKPPGWPGKPCGGRENPPCQWRQLETKDEDLHTTQGYNRGSYSSNTSLIPALGDPNVFYVGTGEYRVNADFGIVGTTRRASSTVEGRCSVVGSDPPAFCTGGEWERANPNIAWTQTFSDDIGTVSLSAIQVRRVAPDGIDTVYNDSGSPNPLTDSRITPSGMLIGIDGTSTVDPRDTYNDGGWGALVNNPQFGIDFPGGPNSLSSREGVVAYYKTPGGPLHWPTPYAGQSPAGQNWVWIGKA